MDNHYYLVNKLHFVRDFNQVISGAEPILDTRYGPSLTASIARETRQEFESLLFHLPYIGDQNPLTRTFLQSTWALALYRVLKSYGRPVDEAGRLISDIAELLLQRYPRPLAHLAGQLKFTVISLSKLKRCAAESHVRRYPGDWVYSYVKGDGSTFDYGIDYTECGVLKFYHSMAADDLAPYICRLDFAVSAATGTGLVRKGTLADGCSCCDFRFKQGRAVQWS